MRYALIVAILALTPGCTVLSALGIGPKDLAPSLSYCEHVKYERKGIKAKIQAECNLPAG